MVRVNINECDFNRMDGGGSPIWEHKGQFFSGILQEYYDSGELCYEQECENGYEEGWYRSYYRNGQKEEEYKTHNNIVVPGTHQMWDEQGTRVYTLPED